MSSIKIVPMLLKHRVDKFGKSAITVRVYLGSAVIFHDKFGKKINPAYWDNEKREVKSLEPNATLINRLLKKRVNELEAKYLQSELLGITLTKSRIKSIAKGEEPGKDFIEYCTKRLPERYPKTEQKETRRSYTGELTKIIQFQKSICFGDITPHFLSRYKAWMINERKNTDNTVWKTFKFINTMMNDALKTGCYIKTNPFADFDRGKYKQTKRSFLEISDCDKIHALLKTDIPERLRLVGMYYLFMCYTGFRFNDACFFFNYDTHVINDERIVFTTQKFATEVNLFIHDRLRVVVEAVKNNPLKMCNKEFNRYTKVLATMAGILINITAHTGRHTFGATLAELNVPVDKAQKLLGHKDRDSTMIYYHIKSKSLDEEMVKWNDL